MRPAEYTNESVIAAGTALQAAGRNITGFALRQAVGGGNPARLKQIWDDHLASVATSQAEPLAALPAELADELASAVKALTERFGELVIGMNNRAVLAADRRVSSIEALAQERSALAERELVDAVQAVDELEDKLKSAIADVEGLRVQLAEAQDGFQCQAIELAQVRERLASTEKAAGDAANSHAAELIRLVGASDAERRQHEQEVASLHEQLKNAAAYRDTCQIENADLRRSLTDALVRSEVAERIQKESTITFDRMEVRLNASVETEVLARESAAELRGQLDATRLQLENLTATLKLREENGIAVVQSSKAVDGVKKAGK